MGELRSLVAISQELADGRNPSTKPPGDAIYRLYDHYFGDMMDAPITLLELGVHSGESLKTFATYFRRGTIIGLDVEDRYTDFSAWPNIRFMSADQRDRAALAQICASHAPAGIDIIIDDASHFGSWSLASYRALFPHLKPGGFYVIEDWATGYWEDWPDGGPFRECDATPSGGELVKRLASHDFGMVGLVKHFVDEVASDGIRASVTAPITRERRLDSMTVHREMVVLRKARSS